MAAPSLLSSLSRLQDARVLGVVLGGAALLLLGRLLHRVFFADADGAVAAAAASLPRNAFKGKVVWITGASSGIGEALALALAERGASLILSARRVDRLMQVAQRCMEAGAPRAEALRLDVEDTASHEAVVAHVYSRVARVDYFVNNAGRSQRGLIEDTPLAVDRALFELNFFGTVNITKALLPRLIAQGGGAHIVNTSSVAALLGSPCSATYSASKAALNLYFDALRMELADRDITVTNVCPGPVRSEITLHAFTHETGKAYGKPTEDSIKRLTAERCAELVAGAMWARIPQCVMAPQPILFYTYVRQYLPDLYFYMAPRAGKRRVAAFRAGDQGYNSVQNAMGIMFGGDKPAAAEQRAPPPRGAAGSKSD